MGELEYHKETDDEWRDTSYEDQEKEVRSTSDTTLFTLMTKYVPEATATAEVRNSRQVHDQEKPDNDLMSKSKSNSSSESEGKEAEEAAAAARGIERDELRQNEENLGKTRGRARGEKSIDGLKKKQVQSPNGLNNMEKFRTRDGRSASESGTNDASPKIRYFCEPNQKLMSDAFKVLLYHMLPFTVIPHLVTTLLLYVSYQRWGWSALVFYTTFNALLTVSPPYYSRKLREAVRDHAYGLLARYVPSAQYAVPEKPFPEDRSYIFACHPHGRMFYSTAIFSQLHQIWRRTILQSGDLFMTAAGGFFHIPVVRNIFYLLGAIPVTRDNIVDKLRNGNHVTILVGGVKEVLLGTEDDVDRLYLKNRKGFCKIAMEERAGVVPVYFFNENQMFAHDSKSFLKFWTFVNRYYKVGVPFMRGRFKGLPMPFRRPLLMAVGEPLFAQEGENVDQFHQRYIEALRGLFDKYVSYSPKPNQKLIIQ